MKFSKRGDEGETSLLGGQRVPKYDLRPETYGALDEASSVLGVARALTKHPRVGAIILGVQKDLLTMGSEMAALPEESAALAARIGAEDVRRLEGLLDDLQGRVVLGEEFVLPGGTAVSAQIDVGRTVIRRAERRTARLKDEGLIDNPSISAYLNRLADLLFVLARYEEQSPR